MRYIFLVSLLSITMHSIGQQLNVYAKIDALALQIPDSSQRSTSGIARYIDGHFDNSTDKSRAIFAWLGHAVQYDVDNMYNVNFNLSPADIVAKTLKERKAICQGYAEVFHEIAGKSGIKNYVIEGYTRQNGLVDYLPHAWVAVYLDTAWYFVDPTWGSGNIQKGKYVKQQNNDYFKAAPEKLITSHIAFDPLFQFLNYPLTNQEFREGNTKMNKTKPFFNYKDTLSLYEQYSDIKKLECTARRIEANGVNNALVFDRLQYIKREIEFQHNKTVVDLYNSAVADFNQAVSLLNHFIEYRNKQFSPYKPDASIKQMVDTVETLLVTTEQKLAGIQNPDKANAAIIQQLNNNLREVRENLQDQKNFLAKYFSTSKMFRKSLFYSYKFRF